jgi:hypothetical protein
MEDYRQNKVIDPWEQERARITAEGKARSKLVCGIMSCVGVMFAIVAIPIFAILGDPGCRFLSIFLVPCIIWAFIDHWWRGKQIDKQMADYRKQRDEVTAKFLKTISERKGKN